LNGLQKFKKDLKATIKSKAFTYELKTRVFGQMAKIPTTWLHFGQSFMKRKGMKNEGRGRPFILF